MYSLGSYPVDELFCPALEPIDLETAAHSLVGAHDGLGVISPPFDQGPTPGPVWHPGSQVLHG